MPSIGFFSELLKDGMARQQLSAVTLAKQIGCSYEHVRKMVRAESFPSHNLLKRMSARGCFLEGRATKYAEIDRARRKFGSSFWICLGKNPKHDELYILWPFLTNAQKRIAYDFLKFLVARNQAADLGNRSRPNDVEDAA